MKKTNKIMAVVAAMVMMTASYVAGKINTATEIKPANIVAVHAAIEEQVKPEEPEVEELVEEEKKKEVFGKLVKVLNADGTLNHFVIFTSETYYKVEYMRDAINCINERCESDFRYDESFGRFQVIDNNTGKAVKVEIFKAVE